VNRDQPSNPLTERYASREMARVFSPDFKFTTWRKLWIALAEAERELGLPVTEAQIAELRAHADTINYDEAERQEYAANLARHVFRPTWLELFVMQADGTGRRQVTDLRAASFAPFMHPNNRQIIFASNLHDQTGRSFALYLVSLDGTGLERVTYEGSFSSFPMFSPDGRQLVFVSSRGSRAPREFNVFLADWVP